MLENARHFAVAGKLEQAVTELTAHLNDPNLPPPDRAQALLLFGRCQLGRLASAKAVIALEAAADIFRDCGQAELAEYAGALCLRHKLDERRSKEVGQAATRLLRTGQSAGWPLVESIGNLYTGLGANEQRRFSDAVRHFIAYLETADPHRLPWEETMARFALEGSVRRGGLDRALIERYGRSAADDGQLGVPRIHVMTQIYQALALVGDSQLGLCFDVLSDLRDYLDDCPGEWAGRLRFIANVESNLGYVCQHLYRHEDALGHYENAISLARERGFTAIEQLALNNMAVVLLWSREFDRSLTCLIHSRANHAQQTFVFQVSTFYLAIAYLALGKLDDARDIWTGRTVFDDNPETRKTMAGIAALVRHLFLDGSDNLPPAVTETARGWLAEVTPKP